MSGSYDITKSNKLILLDTIIKNGKLNGNNCRCEIDNCKCDDGCKCNINYDNIINNIDNYTLVEYNEYVYKIFHNQCFKEFLSEMILINDRSTRCNLCRELVKDHMYDLINYDLCIPCFNKLKTSFNYN